MTGRRNEEWIADLDPECFALCSAMNRLPGVRTVGSCCGHGDYPFQVWFVVDSLDALPAVLYWFDYCHCGRRDWLVRATTDCAMSPAVFCVEGPIGGYDDANLIARLMDGNRG